MCYGLVISSAFSFHFTYGYSRSLFRRIARKCLHFTRKQLSFNDKSDSFDVQMKLQSVKLAMKYLRRVSSELEAIQGGPDEEELMLRGVRFAFRVHQVG
jgi:hypothetical protein